MGPLQGSLRNTTTHVLIYSPGPSLDHVHTGGGRGSIDQTDMWILPIYKFVDIHMYMALWHILYVTVKPDMLIN